jgi:hypothetical protein
VSIAIPATKKASLASPTAATHVAAGPPPPQLLQTVNSVRQRSIRPLAVSAAKPTDVRI